MTWIICFYCLNAEAGVIIILVLWFKLFFRGKKIYVFLCLNLAYIGYLL